MSLRICSETKFYYRYYHLENAGALSLEDLKVAELVSHQQFISEYNGRFYLKLKTFTAIKTDTEQYNLDKIMDGRNMTYDYPY